MPVYVLMTKLAPSNIRDPRGRREIGREFLRKAQELCPGLRWISHYALLGRYDFMDLYEAPNDEVAFRVSLVSRELGAVTAESWPALPYEEFLRVYESVDAGIAGKK